MTLDRAQIIADWEESQDGIEPTDEQLANRAGFEGGIPYDTGSDD